MLDPVSLAISAAMKWGPGLIGSLMGDDAEKVAGDVISMATKATGIDDPEQAVSALEKDPVIALKFEKSLMVHTLKMSQEQTKKLQVVNATMQAESKSEHWPQYSWRPFNGFMFAITLFMNYGFPPIANMFISLFGSDATATTDATAHLVPGSIPEFVFMAWASVLGVATYHRGRAKIQGGEKSAIASGVDAVRNKAAALLGKT
jgi:hypothetical protein